MAKKPLSEQILPEQINNRCNNIIIILDPLHEEKAHRYSEKFAMTGTFRSAIEGQKIPILTTKNIARNFCIEETRPKESWFQETKDEFAQAIFTSNNCRTLTFS